MSFLGRGAPGSNTQGGMNPEKLEMAMAELDMVTDVFNRLVSTCHSKCISTRYAEADLNKGESVCIDRCVAKFFEVNKKVGEKMQTMGANAASGGGSVEANDLLRIFTKVHGIALTFKKIQQKANKHL